MEFISKSFNELTNSQIYEILKSRSEVFLLEQRIVCQDMDDLDYVSNHFFLWDSGRVIAYMRVHYDKEHNFVKAGRILTLDRGRGLGRILMEKGIEEIGRIYGNKKIHISAQKHAVGFYEKFGFKAVSSEYMEEGIPHIAMEL